jgi:acyl carrier protein
MTGAPESTTNSAVLDAVKIGIESVKGATVAAVDITDSTGLWASEDPDQPCLYLDSLDLLELVVFLEQEYGWEIDEELIDAGGWSTVGDLTSVVAGIAGDPARPTELPEDDASDR